MVTILGVEFGPRASRPARVWMEQAPASLSGRKTPKRKKKMQNPKTIIRRREKKYKRLRGCTRAAGTSRAPGAAGAHGHVARGLPTDLGSRRKKGAEDRKLPELCGPRVKAPSAQGSGGFGASGPRQPAEESPPADPAAPEFRGGRARCKPARPPARSAPLRTRRPPAQLSGRSGRRRPLRAGHAPR